MVAGADVFYGLNYGIEKDHCPTLETMKKDFAAIKKYTNRVRTFSLHICNQADMALEAAQALGMQLYLGMWLDRQDTFDLEIQALKQVLAKHDFSNVDAIIAGSEVLYRKDADENTLANWVKEVKQLVQPKGVKVTNAETFNRLSQKVMSELDFVSMNAFPYWEGVAINEATQTLASHYELVKGLAGGKSVMITETGWPSGGDNFGPAVPSIENQNKYIGQVLCWSRKNNVNLLYFSAFEEAYKPGVEGHFGVMDSNGNVKKGINLNPTC
ncbi:glycoside hydrolase superfamily [Phascolomyces articulosus]|uniref:glucan endo-1,3-beta-D-glucosidase n=1 Tax=Phascolomyces articulosus TaxID=60185 RepID=A0AAD5K389_9FUNG|nr:glycoside hydrolase superfamily [Phascolomyces articulosus]